MTSLRDVAVLAATLPEDDAVLVDELIEVLAKRVCKSRPDLPTWVNLSPDQRRTCRSSAKKHLEAITQFFQKKLDAEV